MCAHRSPASKSSVQGSLSLQPGQTGSTPAGYARPSPRNTPNPSGNRHRRRTRSGRRTVACQIDAHIPILSPARERRLAATAADERPAWVLDDGAGRVGWDGHRQLSDQALDVLLDRGRIVGVDAAALGLELDEGFGEACAGRLDAGVRGNARDNRGLDALEHRPDHLRRFLELLGRQSGRDSGRRWRPLRRGRCRRRPREPGSRGEVSRELAALRCRATWTWRVLRLLWCSHQLVAPRRRNDPQERAGGGVGLPRLASAPRDHTGIRRRPRAA